MEYEEGQRLQGSDGNIYVVRGGVPTLETATPASIITKRADPYEMPKNAVDLRNAELSGQRTSQQIAQDSAAAPYVARTAAAQATKAEADAIKAQRDLQAQQSTANPQQQQAMAALANDEILSAIDKARRDIDAGGSAGYWARLKEVPALGPLIAPQGTLNLEGSLNTIASRLTLDKLAQLKQASPTGASGLGSLTEREGALLRDSVAGLSQTQSPERLLENLGAVEKHYRNFRALTNGEDYRDPGVAAKYGIAQSPGSPQAMALAQGGYRDEADPALKGVNNHIRGMIGAGKSANEIVAYMNKIQPGLGNAKAADVVAATKFRSQNPTVPLSQYPISVENRSVPMSGLRETLNNVAQTPGGAFAMQAGDALTAGTLDNMQENPALARAGMQAVSEANPTSALLGTLTGGALAGGAVEVGAARTGATWAPRIADAIYGAAYGAGTADDGDRLEGAAGGAFSGVAGGVIGRNLARAGGNALTGVRDEAAQYLRRANVPLTLPQAVARSGPFGARLKAREDRLSGYGGVGDQVLARRREGLEAFNRAAFNEGLAPIGNQAANQVGEQGIETARTAVSGAYDQALSGVRLTPDAGFVNDMGAALQQGAAIPRVGPEFTGFVNQRIAPHFGSPNGQIDGRQMQDAIQQVRGANFGTDSMGALATDAARNVEGAITDLAERQAPGVMPAFGRANTAYRNLNILSDAVGRGVNTDGIFTPAQLGTAARGNTTRFGGKIAAATPARPFYDLQRAGQQLLPSKVPDSGTAGRVEANGGLTAAIRSAMRNLTNAPLYAESLQAPLNTALLDRPDWAVEAGQRLLDRSRAVGLFGRPLALQYGPTAVAPGY